jgi:hypothetical protein
MGYGTGKPFRKYLVSIYDEVSGLKLYPEIHRLGTCN